MTSIYTRPVGPSYCRLIDRKAPTNPAGSRPGGLGAAGSPGCLPCPAGPCPIPPPPSDVARIPNERSSTGWTAGHRTDCTTIGCRRNHGGECSVTDTNWIVSRTDRSYVSFCLDYHAVTALLPTSDRCPTTVPTSRKSAAVRLLKARDP